MLNLFKIIKKNFKLLIRSKSSALIIILGPLLVIFLVGIAFDNLNKFSLSIGTYSESYTDLTESFIAKLREKNFEVEKIDSQEECINQIKQGKLNTCIVFPKDLSVESEKVNEIVFHVDNSKINLVWMILDTISNKLTERSSELSLDLTTDLLNRIEFTKNELYATKPKVVNLRAESQENVNTIASVHQDILSVKMGDIRTKREEFKTTMLEKVAGAENVYKEVQNKIDNSNLTADQKENINQKLSEIGTYLYNMRGKLEEQSNVTVSEWTQLTDLLNEVDTGLRSSLNSIKANLISSDTQVNEIQAAIDKVYNQVTDIKVTNAATVVNPITTSIKPVSTEKSYLNYLFPALVIMVVMFISILLSTTIVMMEKHSPAYFRNFITPTRDIVFILATYLTNVILVFLQLAIILGISAYFFKAQVLSAIGPTLLILLLGITFFTFAGMIIGYIFTSEETATLASISIGSIFLFLSDVILPLESMPDYIGRIAEYNPFVLGEELLRKAIIFQAEFSVLRNQLLILLGYSAVLLFIIWASQKIVRKHLLQKISYRRHKRKKEKAAKK